MFFISQTRKRINLYIKGFKRFWPYLFKFKRVLQSIPFILYLEETGWYASRENKKKPVNKLKKPIPWFTYPAIHFLDRRIKKGMRIFEFGSGNSTLWFAEKGCTLTTFEHDFEWFISLKDKLPSNVNYNYCELKYKGDYSRSITKQKTLFDIVLIDGRDRVNCAKNAIDSLTEEGVLIWDNSDRDHYKEGYKFLKKNGFKRLEFKGLGPLHRYMWETSIFYRDKNCLGI